MGNDAARAWEPSRTPPLGRNLPPSTPLPLRTPPRPDSLPRPWLAAYPPGVPATYAYPDVPLTRFLDDAARDFPEVAATWFAGATLSYRALVDQVDRLAVAFGELGVEQGSRVGVVLSNVPAQPITVSAVLRRGAVVVAVDPALGDEQLRHRLDDAGCDVVVCLGGQVPRLTALRPRLPDLRCLVATSEGEWLPLPRRLAVSWRRPHRRRRDVVAFRDLIAGRDPVAKQAPVGCDDLAAIVYTPGGRGVRFTHGNLVASAFQARLWIPDIQAGRERFLTTQPLSHAQALVVVLLCGLLSAATVLLTTDHSPDRLLRTIHRLRPTLVHGLPATFLALIDRMGRHDLTSIRVGLTGWAPLASGTARRFQSLTGGRLRAGYGLTEAPLTHANPIYGRANPARMGLPVTDTVAAVIDAAGQTLPAGKPGELIIHGPQISPGYWQQPAAPRLQDGWVFTGDRAVMHDDGSFAPAGGGVT